MQPVLFVLRSAAKTGVWPCRQWQNKHHGDKPTTECEMRRNSWVCFVADNPNTNDIVRACFKSHYKLIYIFDIIDLWTVLQIFLFLRIVAYLLSRVDVGVDVFEDGFQHGVVTYTQVLDLYLAVLRPVFRYLCDIWDHTETGEKG